MYAVINSGGKQHTVSPNLILKIEKIEGEPGSKVEFTDVLLVKKGDKGDTLVGAPYVKDAKVIGEIIKQARDEKVIVFKKKRRHNYRRKNGHRQYSTYVLIKDIKIA
jgi:large subunit ribosomal protein L21